MNTHDPIVDRYVYVQCEGKTYRTYYEEIGMRDLQRRSFPDLRGSGQFKGVITPVLRKIVHNDPERRG